jgi:hypothetical protein
VGAPRGVVNRNGPPEGGRPEGAGARAHAAITPRLFFSFFLVSWCPGFILLAPFFFYVLLKPFSVVVSVYLKTTQKKRGGAAAPPRKTFNFHDTTRPDTTNKKNMDKLKWK